MKKSRRKKRILVKGYMRPNGTSYYVAIPKAIRESLSLTGGEYFMIKADVEDGEIELKLVDLEESTVNEDSSDPIETSESEKESNEVEVEESEVENEMPPIENDMDEG